MAGPAESTVDVTGFSGSSSAPAAPTYASDLPDAGEAFVGDRRKTVPILWQATKSDYGVYVGPEESEHLAIDAMIHLGMQDEEDALFFLETTAYKLKFENADVDGKTPSEDDLDRGGTWSKCPEILETDLDVDSIYRQVTSYTTDINIKTSTNPGRYLSAYIYYASLAHLHIAGEEKRAMLVHVTPENESADIERGVVVITKWIEAIADHAVSSLPAR